MANGHAFDVGTVLGIGTADASPLPEAPEGVIVLRVAEGLSYQGLLDCSIGQEQIQAMPEYEQYDWFRQKIAVGTYSLRVPVPGSFDKTFAEQQTLLAQGEEPAPIALVAAALLCLKKAGQPDPLGSNWTWCAERVSEASRMQVKWLQSTQRLNLFDAWDVASGSSSLALSSVRRIA